MRQANRFPHALKNALIATLLAAVVVLPIFTLHLERAGVRTIIVPEWRTLLWGCLAVFVVQLLRRCSRPGCPASRCPACRRWRPATARRSSSRR